MALEKELEVFNQHRLEWCQEHSGKYAVIQDETVLETFFDDWETAIKAAYKNFGAGRNFLVKEICDKDRVIFIGAA